MVLEQEVLCGGVGCSPPPFWRVMRGGDGADSMKIPSFHDGFFDGFRLDSNKSLQIFLRTANKVPHTLLLEGVQALAISGVKEGNIIFELVFRDAERATCVGHSRIV